MSGSERAPQVRTSDGFFLPFSREFITKSLLKETALAPAVYNVPAMEPRLAESIAASVEKQIQGMGLEFLSGPLIRELVNVELLKRGLEHYRKLYTRVGLPIYEFWKIKECTGFEAKENANLQPNPETIHKKVADRVSKEAALLLLPPHLADAHLKGDLHIHDLGYFMTRPFCQDWDLRYFFYYGLLPDGTGSQTAAAKPAQHAEVAILHAAKVLASAQCSFAGGQGFYGFTYLLAPYLRGLGEEKIKQLAQMMLYELSQAYVARGGQLVFSSLQIEAGVPKIWQDVHAVMAGKILSEPYGSFEDETKKFAIALLKEYIKGDAMGKMFPFPKPEVVMRKRYFESEKEEVMMKAAELSAKFGSTYYDNLIPDYRHGDDGLSCYQCLPADETVFVNGKGAVEIETLFEKTKGQRLGIDGDAEWFSSAVPVEVMSLAKTGEIRPCKVKRLMRKPCSEKIASITVAGGLKIRVGENHPVLVLNGAGKLERKAAVTIQAGDLLPSPAAIVDNSGAIPTNELNLIEFFKESNHASQIRVRNIEFKKFGYTPKTLRELTGADTKTCKNWIYSHSMPLQEFVIIQYPESENVTLSAKFGKTGIIPARVPVNEYFGELVGYYLAEGDDFTKRGLRFSFGAHENERIEKVMGLLRKLFGELMTVSTHSQTYGNYNHTVINVPAFVLCWLFEALEIGRGSHQKRIPKLAFRSEPFARGLLKGLFGGDGSINVERVPYVRLHLANRQLVQDTRLLLLKFGIFSTIFDQLGSSELRISSTANANLALGLLEEEAMVMRKSGLCLSEKFRQSGFLALPVKKVEFTCHHGFLYDLEVDDDSHNFLQGDGIFTSNCCAYKFSDDPTSERFNDKLNFVDGAHFSLGAMEVVSVNMPRLAYKANGNDAKLFEELRRQMGLAKEVLLIKRDTIINQAKHERIPFATQRPKGAPSAVDFEGLSLVIGTVGINEMVQYHLGKQLHEDSNSVRFAVRTIVEMEKIRKEFEAQHPGIKFAIARTPAESTAQTFAVADLIHHAKQADGIVKGKTAGLKLESRDLPVYYTNGTHINVSAPVTLSKKMEIEEKFFPALSGGNIFHVWLGEATPNPEAIFNLNKNGFANSWIGYYAYTKDLSVCPSCGFVSGGLHKACPKCSADGMKWYSRITGYYQDVNGWNEAKKQELLDRYRIGV